MPSTATLTRACIPQLILSIPHYLPPKHACIDSLARIYSVLARIYSVLARIYWHTAHAFTDCPALGNMQLHRRETSDVGLIITSRITSSGHCLFHRRSKFSLLKHACLIEKHDGSPSRDTVQRVSSLPSWTRAISSCDDLSICMLQAVKNRLSRT